MIFIELLGGPHCGLEINSPNCEAIRFRGRLYLRTGELSVDGLPVYWDCGREFHALLDGLTDIEPGRL